jgi:hypothetical protein
MQWSIKAIAGCPKDSVIAQLICTASTLAWYVYFSILAWDQFLKDSSFFFTTTIFFTCTGLIFVAGARQKTIYRYRIYGTKGRLAYQLHYPKAAKYSINTIVFLCIFLMALTGLMTGSLLLLLGPVVGYFMLALRIFTWHSPANRDTSLPWNEYNFVTIDRKYRFIVTHGTDLTVGFEARLPDDALFEQYLAFLRTVLPAHAQYIEKRWEWALS